MSDTPTLTLADVEAMERLLANVPALPWHVSRNPGGPDQQPAFPGVHDASGLPHGEDIVLSPLGDSDRCKAIAAYVVKLCNSAPALIAAWRAISAIGDRIGGQPDATPDDVLGMVNGHCDAYIEMESECATLAAENARLRELLKRLECPVVRSESVCRICGDWPHKPDCQLAAALAGGQEASK